MFYWYGENTREGHNKHRAPKSEEIAKKRTTINEHNLGIKRKVQTQTTKVS